MIIIMLIDSIYPVVLFFYVLGASLLNPQSFVKKEEDDDEEDEDDDDDGDEEDDDDDDDESDVPQTPSKVAPVYISTNDLNGSLGNNAGTPNSASGRKRTPKAPFSP